MANSVVFRLLKRSDSQADQPGFETGWTGRLHAVGRTLDEYDAPLRDLAIMSTGYDTWITALTYFGTGLYHAGWRPITLRIEDHSVEYVAAESNRPRPTRPVGWTVVKLAAPWAVRLRALGCLLDRATPPPPDLHVLDIDGGFVIQALIPIAPRGGDHWASVTREITANQITAASQGLPVANKVRVMRLRSLEMG